MTLSLAIRRARRAVEAMRHAQSGPVACSYDADTQTVRFVNAEYDDDQIRFMTWPEFAAEFGFGWPQTPPFDAPPRVMGTVRQ